VVWRLAAEAHVTPIRGPLHLERAARTEGGEQYWILEPHRLLASLPLPDVGSSHRRPRRIPDPPGPRMLTEHDVTPIAGRKPAAKVAAHERVVEVAAPETVAKVAAREPAVEVARSEPVAKVAAREPLTRVASRERVLIAEDSITARAFLSRMLEARGFEVTATGTADEAMTELARGEWALFFADVELPDARGAEWLRAISERAPARTPVIALVRDREDRESATVAGLSRVLRKPFDPAEVTELIERLTGATRSEP
jgi:CheY-like chemotaxis protein